MAERKYGRLFTEAEVRALIVRAADAGAGGEHLSFSPAGFASKMLEEQTPTFPPDEPLFLLRGQDALAPDVVREYAVRADDPSAVNEQHRVAVWEAADGMREWQAQHPDRVKVPA